MFEFVVDLHLAIRPVGIRTDRQTGRVNIDGLINNNMLSKNARLPMSGLCVQPVMSSHELYFLSSKYLKWVTTLFVLGQLMLSTFWN